MNEFERDIERRLKDVKKREDDIAIREREYDRKEKDQNNRVSALDSRDKDIRVQRLTILNATEQEVKAFEEFKKKNDTYKNIIEKYGELCTSVELLEKELENKIKDIKVTEKANESLQRELLSRAEAMKKKENFLASKEEVIKARDRDVGSELLEKIIKIQMQSEAIKKDIQDFKDKIALKEGEWNTKERDILFAVEKIQAIESNFKEKMESASIITMDLNDLAARLNSKEIELIGREGRIIVIENNIEDIKKEAENLLKEAKEKNIEVDNKLAVVKEKHNLANQKLLNIKEKENIAINKVEKLEVELAATKDTKKSLISYKERLDKDAAKNEEDRLKLAREQGDINRKLKVIEDYEKKNKVKPKGGQDGKLGA